MSKLSFLALAVFAAAPCSALAQVTLQNTASDTSLTLSDTSAIVGQLFATDSTNVSLSAFQVSLLAGVPANTSVNAFIEAWDPLTSAPLNNSHIWDGSTAVTTGSAAQYQFDTGTLTLDPGTTYLFGMQIANSSDSLATLGVSATTAADYGAGSAVEFVTRAQADALGNGDSSTWSDPSGSGWINLADDTVGGSVEGLTFATTLTPVPEASTYAMFGVALCLGLVLYFHRRRQLAAGTVAAPVG